MIDDAAFERIARTLSLLGEADSARARTFRAHAYLARIPAGRDVFVEGQRVDAIPLLLSGVVRVYQIGETGREVTLYRFRPGESCVLTANAILTDRSFPAIATVEEDAEAVMIPADVFREWVARDDVWRSFFFDLVAQRIASVLSVVDDVAFRRLDQRIAALLLKRMGPEGRVRITHQEIAAELGSAREAVSRVLEDLDAKGWIVTARGHIEVTDREALDRIASV